MVSRSSDNYGPGGSVAVSSDSPARASAGTVEQNRPRLSVSKAKSNSNYSVLVRSRIIEFADRLYHAGYAGKITDRVAEMLGVSEEVVDRVLVQRGVVGDRALAASRHYARNFPLYLADVVRGGWDEENV